MSSVLLTGGTGFIGTYVARWFIENTNRQVVALVRADDDQAATRRLSRAWWDRPELMGGLNGRIEAVAGDLTKDRLGLSDAVYRELVQKVGCIVHSAADIRLNPSLQELRQTNVDGVANTLVLANDVQRDHGLERFSHVSTAYVAGGRQGPVPEAELTDSYGFKSNYEQSKYEGERLVRGQAGLPVSVFRPGMVVGSSEDGYIRTFNTLYYPLRLYLTGKLRVFPISPEQKVNLVPVDYVAGAIGRLTIDKRAEGRTFHLVGSAENLPSVRQLVELTRSWARRELHIDLPGPIYFPPAMRLGQRFSKDLGVLAPYLREKRQFQRDNVDELLGPYEVDWKDLLPKLLAFGVYNGFLHRTDRTVHEQVLFRLKSQRRPVRLHDIIDGRIIPRDVEQVRDDMLRAAAGLRSMGVVQGDRVAIVGTNSVRFLTLDVGIGLVGAVSVPLYYTSPPREMDELIEASGAKLLLVGSDVMMRRAGELRSSVPIVSFCRGPAQAEGKRIVSWEELLSHDGERSETSPVGFGDLSTLRYTSGTTGRSKGVLFRHEHLRYMAESTASLPPWMTRNSEVFYLSFLPMNHVVEGILATYSPFYAPAPVSLYFLEDFRGLREALVQVRPTVFFSIPRFYEKLSDRLRENGLARRIMERPEGSGRPLLAPFVRRKTLRAAGLDRCDYLISGSGPMGSAVQSSLHRLGIEVHDAYGLTEAPLVTINYPGRNRLGTVGEPMPGTRVDIAPDGEVLVRGPQVTCGYFGGEEGTDVNGVLHTGDLGRITNEGSLVLEGRKKELLKTAYGKYVNPLRTETLLRDLPAVADALVVGEGRPYCIALIWYEKGESMDIDAFMEKMNRDLSHPEQIKAWAVLANELSVEDGTLTANMKMRKRKVLERFAPAIEAIYSGSSSPEVAHLGRAGRET